MKCTRCKKNIATIHIQDLGQHLCLDCNNDIMAEMLDVEKLEDYSKEISIFDVDKVLHIFKSSVRVSFFSSSQMVLQKQS